MADYKSGYDPKYGYNRNAFAHKAPLQAIMGKVVKLISAPIGLVSEGIHHQMDKRRASEVADAKGSEAASGEVNSENQGLPHDALDSKQDPAHVNLPAEEADYLIASGKAVPTEKEAATHELVPETDYGDVVERDEMDWALDDAALETEGLDDAPVENEEPEPAPSEESAGTLIPDTGTNKGNAALYNKSPGKLPFPVILPQRRPGTKARGFVRAYAPVLEESGIDQQMFLKFLKDFHKTAQASPIFQVVLIATFIASAYPDIVVGLAIQAVQIAAGIGQEMQERYSLNKFLNQANQEIFIPRGLFVLIVKYKPGDSDQTEIGVETVDLGAAPVAKYAGDLHGSEETPDEQGDQEKINRIDKMTEKMKQLRVASGETNGEAEMPITCAPLTFPQLDAIADAQPSKIAGSDGVGSAIKAKSTSASKFVSDYYDRRAQARYAINNPNSTLTKQVSPIAPQFKSRYADPNNATNTHFFTLITGGRYKAEPLGAKRRWEKAQRKAAEKRAQGIKETPKKRILSENVLYLMVVNMPTQQELEKAKKEI